MSAPQEFAPAVYVDLYQTRRRTRSITNILTTRPQRWRWRAINAGNGKVMATASEAYTNRQDCIDAATQLFSAATTVFLREAEHGNVLLRQGCEVNE